MMATTHVLRSGRTSLTVQLDAHVVSPRPVVVAPLDAPAPHDDDRRTPVIAASRAHVFAGRLVDEMFERAPAHRRPLVVVPDRTRDAVVDVLLPEVLRHTGSGVRVAFASGIHTPMTTTEMDAVVGRSSTQVKFIAHDARGSELATVGVDDHGNAIVVNRALADADLVVVLSAMRLHYLAGVGGGRKMLIPGLASVETATRVHAASFDIVRRQRAHGIGPGALDDNPMHAGIVARLEHLPPAVGVCVDVDAHRSIVDATAGELVSHHLTLARRHIRQRTVFVGRKFTSALVSAGGAPFDSDLVQTHKALVSSAAVVVDGGRIALVAACPDGFGNRHWPHALHDDAATWAARLVEDFTIAGQTAWSWRELCARFDVGLMSNLNDDDVKRIGATPLRDVDEVKTWAASRDPIVLPDGAAFRYIAGADPSDVDIGIDDDAENEHANDVTPRKRSSDRR